MSAAGRKGEWMQGRGNVFLPRGRERPDEGAGRNQQGFSLLDFARKDEGRRNTRPSMIGQLGHLLRGLGCWLCCLLCLLLGRELLLHLEGDGFGVHLVGSGGFLEDHGGIAPRRRQEDACFHRQPGECAFIRTTNKRSQRFSDASIIALLPDAMLPCQHLDAVLIHDAHQLFENEEQVTLQETNGNSGAHSGEDTEASRIGDGLLLALLVLLGLPLLIVAAGWLLRMMNGAGWIGTYLVDSSNVATFGDDGLGGELAHLELGTLGVVFRLRLIVPNRGVAVPWQYRASIFLCAISCADLYQLRLRRDSLRDVR